MEHAIRMARLAVAFCFLLLSGIQAEAAGWSSTRDTIMKLAGQGLIADAYRASVSYRGGDADDLFDEEFVSGWIALEMGHTPNVAIEHFKKMSAYISSMKSEKQGVAKAKTGYWLGRTLNAMGKRDDAIRLLTASMAYTTTFYGQLSASELKTPITKQFLPQATPSQYPEKNLYWHDSRVRKELVLAVIREESRFKQSALSKKKARGMMQVLDSTAKHVGKQAGIAIDVNMMRENEDYNIAVGSRYLADLVEKYNGNPMLAVAGYNAGPLRVDNWMARFGDPRSQNINPVDWIEQIPIKETREYVQKVMGSYMTYLALGG